MSTQTTGLHIPRWTRGDRLRKAREDAGLTQGALADLIGVARNTVSNYEVDATTRPIRAVLINWARETEVPLSWLEDGTEPPRGGGGLPRLDSNQEPAGYLAQALPRAADAWMELAAA